MTINDNTPLFPPTWQPLLEQGRLERQHIGRSDADVFRLRRHAGDLFLKSERADAFSELPAEVEKLKWMRRQGLAVPEVVEFTRHAEHHWLLMSALPGRDLASEPTLPPERLVAIMAQALRRLHALPYHGCPFDQRLSVQIPLAQQHLQAGLVDESDFDTSRLGKSAAELFATLLAERPAPETEDWVVTHGDPCLPNLMADGDRFSGFIDCGRLGCADRYQDLALASRSIGYNLGSDWVAPFFRAYGIVPDEARLEYYRLLDEFF
ncbi:aminoglycoside 3'-phosphotransferase [Serratia rubidaea]|uniref:APH(3') family aminoglycoside O-phosphotransferase n=1 Tax=Serratia rubidaea TaxID=61652 RepID=UPI0023B10E2A|nr:APH(3') family aminoglycoside O-phosphotransferase [Serratia rubidaea]MDK1704636.1 aminoglycoside 3'-phosphotransferase [Serratia rubidaea]